MKTTGLATALLILLVKLHFIFTLMKFPDAEDLLKESFKCPMKNFTAVSPANNIYKYTGNTRLFRVTTNTVTTSGSRSWEYSTEVSFNFADSDLGSVESDQEGVTIACAGGKPCMTNNPQGEDQLRDQTTLTLCDAETAGNVKLAIDTLVKLSHEQKKSGKKK